MSFLFLWQQYSVKWLLVEVLQQLSWTWCAQSICWCMLRATKNDKLQPWPKSCWYTYPPVLPCGLLTKRCLQVKQLRVLLPRAQPWVQRKKSRKVTKKLSRPVQSKARGGTTKANEPLCRKRRKMMRRHLRYCDLLCKLHLRSTCCMHVSSDCQLHG